MKKLILAYCSVFLAISATQSYSLPLQIEELTNVRETSPLSSREFVLYQAALRNFSEQDYSAARRNFEASIRENPNFFPAMVGLAEIEDLNGNRALAEEHFANAFEAVPDSAILHTAYGRFLFKYREIDNAVAQFEDALAIDPQRAEAHVELAVIELSHFNNPASAIAHYQQAITLRPENISYLYGLSTAQLANGELENAIDTLTEVANLLPDNSIPWQFMGVYYSRAGQFDKALEALDRAVSIDPDLQDNRWRRADVYANAGQLDNAVSEYQWLAENGTQSGLAYFRQGLVYHVAGDFTQAKESYFNAIAANGQLPDAYNNLAYLSIDTGSDFNAGIEWAAQAIELAPGNPSFLDTLGWLYYRMGDFELARQNLERATMLPGASATVHYHLGKAYEALGEIDRAEAKYLDVQNIDPDFDLDQ